MHGLLSYELTEVPQGTKLNWNGSGKAVLEGVKLFEVGQVSQTSWEGPRYIVLVHEQGFQIDVVTNAFGNFSIKLVFRQIQTTQ